jgi:hypothetical protein
MNGKKNGQTAEKEMDIYGLESELDKRLLASATRAARLKRLRAPPVAVALAAGAFQPREHKIEANRALLQVGVLISAHICERGSEFE